MVVVSLLKMASTEELPASLSNPATNSRPASEESRTDLGSSSGTTSENVPTTSPPAAGSVESVIRVTATIRTQAVPQPQQPQPTNNNNGEFPQQTQNLFLMRDRLFLALFFRVSLIYARTVPKTLRRVFEFCLLMQSLLLLFILG